MIMKFIIYDLVFLVLFTLTVVIFLYTHRKNLKREGLLYLYRTKIGIKFIDSFTKKYKKILKPLQYLVIFSGYALMITVLWVLVKISWAYLTSPFLAKAIKVPILIPLIPYLPDIFHLDFLPSFPFTYWIIIIAIIAIPHEFAHGIFARLNKIKVHSTGFGFLGPFLAAFVEPDEKQMNKAKKFPQLAILASGTFANVIFTVIFIFLLWIFFISTFAPAGVYFNTYSVSILNTSEITFPSNFSLDSAYVPVISGNNTYYANPQVLKQTLDSKFPYIQALDDSPAFKSNLSGAISEIDGKKILSFDELKETLNSKSPYQEITITTINDKLKTDKIKEQKITLSERNGRAFLGIGIIPPSSSGLLGSVYNIIAEIKNPLVYYQSYLGDFGLFIYNLLWWTVMISLSVALVNMLPVGIFDGGRFFFLTVWGITGSEKFARKLFKIITIAILVLVAALMLKWVSILF